MSMLRDAKAIKMTQIELLKMETVFFQLKNILGRVKNKLDTTGANIN